MSERSEEPKPAPAPAAQTGNPLTGLLTTITGALGLTVSVASLNRDRVWILIAVLVGLLGVAGVISSLKVVKVRKRLYAAGTALIVIACAVLVVAPAPASDKPRKSTAAKASRTKPAPAPRARLEVTQVVITGGTGGQPVTLDVTLHNTGTRLAALTTATLTVRDFAYLPVCYTAGSIQAGATYPLALPDRPTAGTEKSVPLHETVAPDQVDRFPIRLVAPPFRTIPKYHETVEASFAYVLEVTVGSDSTEPVELGTYVVSLPGDPNNRYQVWNLDDPDRLEVFAQRSFAGHASDLGPADARSTTACMDANSRALGRLLKTDAQRSDNLGQVMTGPVSE